MDRWIKPLAPQVRRRRRLYRAGVLGTIVERGSTCATRHGRDANPSYISAARCGVATPSARRLTQRCVRSRRWRSSNARFAVRKKCCTVRRATRRTRGAVRPQLLRGCWAQRCAGRSRSSCGRAAVVREAHERRHSALVRLQRAGAVEGWELVGYCTLALSWPPLFAKTPAYCTTAGK